MIRGDCHRVYLMGATRRLRKALHNTKQQGLLVVALRRPVGDESSVYRHHLDYNNTAQVSKLLLITVHARVSLRAWVTSYSPITSMSRGGTEYTSTCPIQESFLLETLACDRLLPPHREAWGF